jgi:hypothetical protein
MAGRAPKRPSGPKALRGSADAKRKAAVFLEALAGLRTTQSAAEALETTLPRYYVLETRMLQAMVTALEPGERGRRRSEESQRRVLREENERLEREVQRLQSLYRATQRALGVEREPAPSPDAKDAKAGGSTTKVRRPRRETRGQRVLKGLRAAIEEDAKAAEATLVSGDRSGGEP